MIQVVTTLRGNAWRRTDMDATRLMGSWTLEDSWWRGALRRCKAASSLILLLSCSSPTDVPDRPPNIEGTIRRVFGPPVSVLIKGEDQECGDIVGVGARTKMFRSTAVGGLVNASESDFKVGAYAKVWNNGNVLASCPGQTGADVIVVYP